ncbi:uncharacterized protein LOC130649519 [Hydractinia symbiolongicarpus]|uniref:uncharacterized protein LOC130649519 n=1 Tax=Hydractinia symbiolongicarpus TaxID=13093 RepID=UPI002549E944|nr:uncharacterized protein LOC130649519 [Hydractinia symbiolongicarpus]
MDRAKAVVIILVCFGLLISFILLVTSVATTDLLEKHADEDCLPDRKKRNISCSTETASLQSLLNKLNQTELLRIQTFINQKLGPIKPATKAPLIDATITMRKTQGYTTKTVTTDLSQRILAVKINPNSVCLVRRTFLQREMLGCQNRTSNKFRFVDDNGLVVVKITK